MRPPGEPMMIQAIARMNPGKQNDRPVSVVTSRLCAKSVRATIQAMTAPPIVLKTAVAMEIAQVVAKRAKYAGGSQSHPVGHRPVARLAWPTRPQAAEHERNEWRHHQERGDRKRRCVDEIERPVGEPTMSAPDRACPRPRSAISASARLLDIEDGSKLLQHRLADSRV